MIWIDWPLFLTGLFFFLLSWLYAFGLLHFFRYNFRWSLASVVGIASVISVTYVTVWQMRGAGELQAVWDLAIIFLCALPGMTCVDYQLMEDEEKKTSRKIERAINMVERILHI